jgi:hypothetical protein
MPVLQQQQSHTLNGERGQRKDTMAIKACEIYAGISAKDG